MNMDDRLNLKSGPEAKQKKKNTIFRMFLFPLITVMLLQGILALGTLIFKKTFRLIKDYSINIMSRTVEGRRVILENEMTQRWASVCEQRYDIHAQLESFLARRHITLDEMLMSEELCQEFQEEVFPGCLESLQNHLTSGIFLILTGKDRQAAGEYGGFFIRDYNPLSRAVNYTDIMLERGNKRLSRAFNIPLDTCWTTNFHMAGAAQRESERFFYEPWRAGEENPDADTEDLGYWSAPFILGEDPQDSHVMITYSVPLRHDGRVYGILGTEIELGYLYDFFPLTELDDGEQSGYMLAVEKQDGSYTALAGRGVLYNRIAAYDRNFDLGGTDDDRLYRVKDIEIGKQAIYAVKCPLRLYDNNAPYDDTNWVLIGLNMENTLFGMYRKLYLWMGTAILVGLVFGIVGIYLSVRHLTKPIQKLMDCISGGSAGLKDFQASNILEIDRLYDVVMELTCKQKETEGILLEEKERYRVAIESTSDIFFSYDVENQSVDIVNYPPLNGTWQCGRAEFMSIERVYCEDRPLIEQLLQELPNIVSVEVRLWYDKKGAYQWREIYGHTMCDHEGKRIMMVGAIRNIQEQKERELAQKEKKEKDSVTGLYTYAAGLERLEQCRKEQPQGAIAYLFLEKLQEMNETNGTVFGDMVLEQAGQGLLGRCKRLEESSGCRTVALRVDGDEVVIWMENISEKHAAGFVQELTEAIHTLFDKDILQLYVRAGIAVATGAEESMLLMRRAKLAQRLVKEDSPVNCLIYDELQEKDKNRLPKVHGKHVITNDYGKDVNLASLAVNLFGRGANFRAQMTLILRKIGSHYKASDVLTTIVRPDFHSNYLEYQWHREAAPVTELVSQYTEDEWKVFQGWLGPAQTLPFTAQDGQTAALRKFLNVSEGQCGVILPMYDSGNYMGNVCIVGVDPELLQNAEERRKLAELGGAIQSQLNQKQYDLASKAKSDFLSRMSHEIRTPMNGIMGMATIALQKEQSRERMLDCLNKIQDSSKYLLGLINDILDMSKIESGKMHLEPQNFDIQEMIGTIRELVLPQMEAKNIQYIQEVDLKHSWFVGDKLRISQVLVNLLGNASKFTPENGKVTLTVQERDSGEDHPLLCFAVQDNGVGIGEEDRKRVFRAFEQAVGADAVSKLKGTGLGLSISNRLVQMMGSSIKLESELGKGSIFSFEIPLEPGQNISEEGEEEVFSFEGRRVLVVEDNELNSEISRCLLEDSGFAVDCVYDGAQAVERIKTTEPGTYDLILMDIMMPVMDGLDATRAIRAMEREDCRQIPIVAMSANAFDDDMKKSVECGMNGHLSKPVEVEKLYKMLRDVLRSS